MKKIVSALLLTSSFLLANGEYVTYNIDGKDYQGYYSSPSKNAPLVFMIHDWDGIDKYEIKRAEMLNDMGYAVFAADMFGKDVVADTVEKRKALTGALYKDREKMRTLINGGFDEAKKLGANTNNAVGLGYCFGGTVILEMARSGAELKKFVPFHGGLTTPKGQDYSKVKGEIVVFHGTADKAVSMDDFADIAKRMEAQKVTHEMLTYSGAPHAFTKFGSDRYHERADKASWKRFSEILDETLKK